MEGERLDTSFQLNVKGTTNLSDTIAIIGIVTAEAHDENGLAGEHPVWTINQ